MTPPGGAALQRAGVVLFAAFVALRLVVLLSSPWALYDDEESYNGTVARELARDHVLPVVALAYFPHEGGALVLSVLTAPLVRVLGDSFVVVKLPALLVATLGLVAWWRLMHLLFGTGAALWFVALVTLGPPLLLRSQLMLWGHHESVWVFVALALIEAYHSAATGPPVTKRRHALRAGLVCGLGIFWAPLFAVALPVVGRAVWRGCDTSARGDIAGRFVAGASLGLLPWLCLNAMTGFAGLELFTSGRGAAWADPAEALGKLGALLAHHFPRSPGFETATFSLAYAGLLGGGALAALVVGRRPGTGLLALFLCSFAVLYAVSGFDIGGDAALAPADYRSYRYLLPCYPVLLALVAGLAAGGGARSRARWRCVPAVGLLLLGAVSAAAHSDPARFGTGLRFRGYSYERFGWRAYERASGALEEVAKLARQLDPLDVDDFYRGVGWGIGEFYDGPAERAPAHVAALPAAWRALGFDGLGWAVAQRTAGDHAALAALAGGLAPGELDALYRGFGWAVGRRFLREPRRAAIWLARLDPAGRASAFHGLGRAVAEHYGSCATDFVPELGTRDAALTEALEGGIREALSRMSQGRFLDGPIEMQWDATTFYAYSGPRCAAT